METPILVLGRARYVAFRHRMGWEPSCSAHQAEASMLRKKAVVTIVLGNSALIGEWVEEWVVVAGGSILDL